MPVVYKAPPNANARSHYLLRYDWGDTAGRFAWDATLLVDTVNEAGGEHIPQRLGILLTKSGLTIKVWRHAELARREQREREGRKRPATAPPDTVGAARPAKRAHPGTRPDYPPFAGPFSAPPPSPRASSSVLPPPLPPGLSNAPLYPPPPLPPASHGPQPFY